MNTLYTIATVSIITGFICMLIILTHILSGNKQHMMIMNFVWPITGLYAGPLALLAYYTIGRKSTQKNIMAMKEKGVKMKKPYWQSVTTGALHCGSGCTIGDIIAETLLLNVTKRCNNLF